MERAKTPYIVAFTGHRTYNHSHDDIVRNYVKGLIEGGARRFRIGMAEGFDLAAGSIVKQLRSSSPHPIKIELYIPYPHFHAHLNDIDRHTYQMLFESADSVTFISESYHTGVYRQRNEALVDGADLLVAWWNGRASGTGQTVGYALKSGCHVKNLYRDQQLELEI
ncbi:MAG: DUF1273 family protein [Alistipes sp.]|nr:DUF1273 family protein [Alistipes sp.]